MQSLHLIIRSREKVEFEGKVATISSVNQKGVFDILVQHENFISLLDSSLKIRLLDGNIKDFPVASAVVKVTNNQVEVFVGVKK